MSTYGGLWWPSFTLFPLRQNKCQPDSHCTNCTQTSKMHFADPLLCPYSVLASMSTSCYPRKDKGFIQYGGGTPIPHLCCARRSSCSQRLGCSPNHHRHGRGAHPAPPAPRTRISQRSRGQFCLQCNVTVYQRKPNGTRNQLAVSTACGSSTVRPAG